MYSYEVAPEDILGEYQGVGAMQGLSLVLSEQGRLSLKCAAAASCSGTWSTQAKARPEDRQIVVVLNLCVCLSERNYPKQSKKYQVMHLVDRDEISLEVEMERPEFKKKISGSVWNRFKVNAFRLIPFLALMALSGYLTFRFFVAAEEKRKLKKKKFRDFFWALLLGFYGLGLALLTLWLSIITFMILSLIF